jgi:hypothetical protein
MRARYILLCAAAGAAIGGGMIAAHAGPGINPLPGRSSPEVRNRERTDMLHQLATALTQYRKDHGSLPVSIGSSTQICTSFGNYCSQVHLADLSFLMTGGNYIPTIPTDPLGGTAARGTGLFIEKFADGSLRLSAPRAELGQTISLSFAP